MKTRLVVEITHEKPLPTKTPLTDVLSQRLYGYLYSQGVEAGVKAALEDKQELQKEPWE